MTRPGHTPSRSSLVRSARSFGPAVAGIGSIVRTQPNIRFQMLAGGVVVAVAAWLRVPAVHWAILLLCVGLVLSLELMNSAVEAVVDLASPELHPLAKASKDAAAGAVLVASIFSAIVGVLLLGPPLWEKIA